ncbi:MAG: glycerol kinase [Acidimicrobiaceae bacterium]|nr:glycerol kinase [Acidimicrobiaceae bacterium]
MSLLVVDVGTSSVRATRVSGEGELVAVQHRALAPSRPSPGVVEIDAAALAEAVLELSSAALVDGKVDGVGITAQRASTIVWDRATGKAVGPGIGWQDLRTAGQCLLLRQRGLRLSPSQSATKLAYLLDRYDPGREQDLCFGTVETFTAWVLSEGRLHVSDPSNAGVTGLVFDDASAFDPAVLEALRIPETCLPTLVDSTGVLGPASALSGAPPIAALIGDQQASLIGQGCLRPGDAKATFGTGGMVDCGTGFERPRFRTRGEAGTFPVVAWQEHNRRRWGVEAVMLSAGSCVEWLCQIGVLSSPAESDALAASVRDAGGTVFVPALGGLGAPAWDFGARGAFLGLDPSVGRAELVRAVLEGIAQRGADLVAAVEADTGADVGALRVDGGMSANDTFLQLLADASQKRVERSPVLEATTLGAAYLAGVAVGTWGGLEEAAATQGPREVIEPRRRLDRTRWREAVERSRRWVPAMSALEF